MSYFAGANNISKWVYPWSSLTLCSYGYRGRDCRTNVYLLPTGEIVYFIASVVILFNYEERTQRHYLGHTDCVKWWENNHMIVALLCCWLVCVDPVCLPVWPSILIRSGSPRDRLQEWTKMDGYGLKKIVSSISSSEDVTNIDENCTWRFTIINNVFGDSSHCSLTFGSGTAFLSPLCRSLALVHLSEVLALCLSLKLWVSRCILGTELHWFYIFR